MTDPDRPIVVTPALGPAAADNSAAFQAAVDHAALRLENAALWALLRLAEVMIEHKFGEVRPQDLAEVDARIRADVADAAGRARVLRQMDARGMLGAGWEVPDVRD